MDLSRVMAALVGPGGEVVGIDRSEGALASALAAPLDSEIAPIRYRSADLSGELPDLGQFDAIVGRRVLMYLPNAAATLNQLAQLAKPGTVSPARKRLILAHSPIASMWSARQ